MIYNKSKKTEVSSECRLCKSQVSKFLGLMFRTKPEPLVFVFGREKIIPLHMFFVFFPIDVLYLNKKKEVVELKKGFKPFTFYTPRKKALYVVELPAGSIGSSRISRGDKISF